MNLKYLFLLFIPFQVIGQLKPSSKDWAFIPKGEVFIGSNELRCEYFRISNFQNMSYSQYTKNNKTIQEFYILKYEVSNKNYTFFLDYLKLSNSPLFKIYQPKEASCSIYSDSTTGDNFRLNYYFKNYPNFPIIGISYEAAMDYCLWLENILKKELKRDLEIRLPNEDEWVRAASGKNIYTQYPWKNDALKDVNGLYMCNFKPLDEKNCITDVANCQNIKIVYAIQADGHYFPAPMNNPTYPPNDFGIYNLSGNVSEMLFEKGKAKGGSWFSTANDIKITAINEYTEPSCYVGFRPILILK